MNTNTKTKTILCIDDSVERYDKLHKLCWANEAHGYQLIITRHMEDITWYLDRRLDYNIIGICLDHDLGSGLPTGHYIAKYKLFECPDIPVAIVSVNQRGADNIANTLREQDHQDVVRSPVTVDPIWASRLLGYFHQTWAKKQDANPDSKTEG